MLKLKKAAVNSPSIGQINECHDRAICRTGCVPPVVRSRNILIAGHVAPALVRVVADVYLQCLGEID